MDAIVEVAVPTAEAQAAAAAGADASAAASSPLVAAAPVRSSEPVKLEHQLVKVPYELLKKSFRVSSRAVEKEFQSVSNSVAEFGKKDVSKENVVEHLNSCLNRLTGFKRKFADMCQTEEDEIRKSRVRLDYLNCLSEKSKDPDWKKKKLDRLIVDHLLRSSYIKTATKLVETSSIQDLSDLSLFVEAQQIIDSLKGRGTTKALSWCSENKGKLKKAESPLEFKLRIQEFIELVRAEKIMDALTYARKSLAQLAGFNMREFQEAMTTLVLKPTSEIGFHKELLDENRWEKLVLMFKDEFCKLHGMSPHSLFYIHFQAGLSALKTPSCYQEQGCIKEDPLSLTIIRELADPLPFMKHTQSKLVCHITKELMDENNPPFVLPNGYVYSKEALQLMAASNDGKVTCPRTGDEFAIGSAIRAFVS